MKRLLTTLVAVAALAGSAAACTNPIDPPAATVAGEEISRSEFQSELKALARAVAINDNVTADTMRIDREVANLLIEFRVVSVMSDHGFARYGLEISQQDLDDADQAGLVGVVAQVDADLAGVNRQRLARINALNRHVLDANNANRPWWSDDDVVSVARLIGVLSARQGLGALDAAGRTRVEDTLREVASLNDWLALEGRARGVSIDPRYGSWSNREGFVIPPQGPLQPGGDVDLSTLFGGG